jgi:hypothetical protein
LFSPLKLKGKERTEIPLPVSEVGLLEKDHRILSLEFEGMEKARQGLVGLRPFERAVLEASVSENHMRADHPLSEVVIEGDLRVFKEGEEMKPVSEEAFGKASQAFIAVFPARPEEEALLQELDSPLVDPFFKLRANCFKFQCVSENTLEDSAVFQKCFRLIFEIKGAHLSQEMDETFLLLSGKPGVGRIKVRNEDAPVVFGENLPGNFGSSRLSDLVIGKFFIHHCPEPMVGTAYLPPRLIHMKVRALTDRFEDLADFNAQPLAHPLEGLGQSPFRDLEVSEALEELFDLIEGKPMVILQDDSLDQDVGTEIPVRNFLRGMGSRDHLLTMGAVVTVLLKKSHLGVCRDEVFLGVLDHFLRSAQPVVTIGTALEGLFDHPVNRLGLHPGQAFVPRFLARGLRTACVLGLSQGLQEFLPGFALFLLPEFFLELLDFSFFFKDDFNQLFFGFLGKEQLAVSFHNPNNGQKRDFFEGIASDGS